MGALGIVDAPLFAATVFVLNATPGVDLLFTLTRTLQLGVRGGLAAAAGITAGCVLHALAAAFGLAALLAASAAAFNLVKWLGAAYLVWLAIGMLRVALRPVPPQPHGVAAATPSQARGATGAWAVFRQGMLTNALNPKVALFFLALLPQFIAADAPHKTLAFLVLGAWFVLQGGGFLALFVLLVAPLKRWSPKPAVLRGLNAAGGGLFLWLALKLARAER